MNASIQASDFNPLPRGQGVKRAISPHQPRPTQSFMLPTEGEFSIEKSKNHRS